MLTWIRRLLAPPVFVGDEDKTLAAWLLHTILLALFASTLLFRVITWLHASARPTIFIPLTMVLLGVMFLLHRGYVRLASVITVMSVWLSLTALAIISSGIRSAGFCNYIFVVLIAGLLLSRGAVLATAGLSILTRLGMWWAEISGLLPVQSLSGTSLEPLSLQAIDLLLAAVLVTLAKSRIEGALARVRAELNERKRLEAAQRESRQQYESLVQSIDGIVWEANPKTFEFTFVSQQTGKILGYTVEQWLTDPNFWIENVHADDRDWAIAFCVAATQRKEDHQFDYRMIAADGRVVWLRDFVTVSVAEDQSVRLRGVMVDITERMQAELELRASEECYRSLVSATAQTAWRTDATGKGGMEMASWRVLTGLSDTESDGWGWLAAIHPKDREQTAEAWSHAVKTQSLFETEYRLRTTAGSYRDYRARGVPVRNTQGTIREWVGTLEDITERKQAEQQLKTTSEQLRALTASLSSAREDEGRRIAREIHDELGTLLTSLRGELEGCEKTLASESEQVQIQALRKKLVPLLKLTDTMISTIRRIAAELRPSVLDDLGLAEALEWQAQEFQARTGIQCQCDCLLENFTLSKEQATALFRITQEALTNVLRHAQATRVAITMAEQTGEFVLTIRDNGTGITAQQLAGTQALGLLGMRERAHLIGGATQISGLAGKGTVVTVRVPLSGSRKEEP